MKDCLVGNETGVYRRMCLNDIPRGCALARLLLIYESPLWHLYKGQYAEAERCAREHVDKTTDSRFQGCPLRDQLRPAVERMHNFILESY